ncbi:hypothetical protein BJ742DRAFT_811517 [Cladochytrium replicatum]|nr:hypothetical protein BJ742DRAFT_811517 [Cladochytrium replicatum]
MNRKPQRVASIALLSLSLAAITAQAALAASLAWDSAFAGGSLNGFYTYDEVNGLLHEASKQHPDMTELIRIGESVEGRPIPCMTITNKTDKTVPLHKRPVVLITSLTSPREVLSLMTVLYTMRVLLNPALEPSDGLLASVSALTATTKLIFVPVVNPDGYEAFRRQFEKLSSANGDSASNEGYRLTYDKFSKKNRGDYCAADDLKRGVNLLYNFDYMWDTYLPENEKVDSNVIPRSNIFSDECGTRFHGPAPFSEPETEALRNCFKHEQPKLAIFMRQRLDIEDAEFGRSGVSIEPGSSRVVFPYTYAPEPTANMFVNEKDWSFFKSLVDSMNTASGAPGSDYGSGKKTDVPAMYVGGGAMEILGMTMPGTDVDWAFDQVGAFAMSLQLGGAEQSLPMKQDIEKLASKHLHPILSFAARVLEVPKKQTPKHRSMLHTKIGRAVTYGPLIAGIILLTVLSIGYVIARFYLKYDRVWERFKTGAERFRRRWTVYKEYSAVRTGSSRKQRRGNRESSTRRGGEAGGPFFVVDEDAGQDPFWPDEDEIEDDLDGTPSVGGGASRPSAAGGREDDDDEDDDAMEALAEAWRNEMLQGGTTSRNGRSDGVGRLRGFGSRVANSVSSWFGRR